MGDKVLCEKSDLMTIADAVRDATGLTDHFNVPDLAEKTCEALAGSGSVDITIPLAELNAANGGTAATTIEAAVDNAEAHASSQETLIAQIAEALEGKAAGGSAIETCTVTINTNLLAFEGISVYEDGLIKYKTRSELYYGENIDEDIANGIAHNIVCGSVMWVYSVNMGMTWTCTGCTKIAEDSNSIMVVINNGVTNASVIGTSNEPV